jgi:50S ribosomal protein L16 3-hydroxylase
MHLQDTLTPEGRYADPDLRLQAHPGEISRAMLTQIEGMIATIQWSKRDIAEFAGRYLSEPKPNVFFDVPDTPLTRAAFNKQATKHGIALNPKSRLLFAGDRFFINGEAFTPAADETAALKQLADQRRLAPARGTPPDARPAGGVGAAPPLPATLRERFYDWYEAGWLEIETA